LENIYRSLKDIIMMYKKRKTIKGYMGGGYVKPMGYQPGGTVSYRPGISSRLYGMGLQRDVDKAMDSYQKQAKKFAKEGKMRKRFGDIGAFLGGAFLPKGIGEGVGSFLGELAAGKIYDAGDLRDRSQTGLFRKDFEELVDMSEEQERGTLGRAVGRGAGAYLGKFTKGIGGNLDMLKGDAKSVLNFGRGLLKTPGMEGKVVDASGSLIDIPSANLQGAMDYFGYQEGGEIGEPPTLSRPIRELELRRDYGADRRSSAAIRREKEEEELDRLNMEEAYISSLPLARKREEVIFNLNVDPMGKYPESIRRQELDLGLEDLMSVSSPSLIGEDFAIARDSLNMQRKYEDLARNLGMKIDEMKMQSGNNSLSSMKKGGMIGYQHGGLINMMPYSRRIV
jgi:hypothetical protein